MTAPIRATVIYGRDADAWTVARAADLALAGHSGRVMVGDGDDAEVWILDKWWPESDAVLFSPGQRLVITSDNGWRIEDATEAAA